MNKKFVGRYSCLGVVALVLLLILAGITSASYQEPKKSDVTIQSSVWQWVPVNIAQDDTGWYPGYKIDKDSEFLTMDTPFDSGAYIEKDFDVPLSETSNLYLEVWGAQNIRGRCGSPVNVQISVIDTKNTPTLLDDTITILDNFVPIQRDYNIGPGEPKHYSTSIFAGKRIKVIIYQTSSYKFCAIGNYKNISLFTPTPIADFKVNKTSVMMPQTVKFTDSSIGAISWEWDFNNDGIIDSIDKNPSHTYTNTGTYTVSLKVRGPIGPPSQMKKNILVDVIDNQAQVLEVPVPSNIEFRLSGKSVVTMGEETEITLSVTNLITNPSMKAQLSLRVPPEIDVYSKEFSKTGVGGELSSVEYDVKPGDSRHIAAGVKPNQEGSFNITGWILYYFAGNKTDIKNETRKLNIKVNTAIGEPTKDRNETEVEQGIIYQERLPVHTGMPIASPPKAPGFDVALAIVILSTGYLIRRRYN